MKVFTNLSLHNTGALNVWGGMQQVPLTSCVCWSSLLGQPVLPCVLLTTWTMLGNWSRDLCSGVRSVPSMPQVCTRSSELSVNICKSVSLELLILCFFWSDLLSEEDLQTLADLTGCSARHRVPSCNSITNLDKFRTVASVCNNRWDRY